MESQLLHDTDVRPVAFSSGQLAHQPRVSGVVQAKSHFKSVSCANGRSNNSDLHPPGALCQSGVSNDMQVVNGPAQLLYSLNGLFVVHSDAGHWVVQPDTLLQLLPGIAYTIRKADQVSVRSITLSELPSQGSENCLYSLTPLLRELLEALYATPAKQEGNTDSKALLLAELLAESGIRRDETTHRCRSMPSDPRIAQICNYVYDNLDAPRTLQEWATELNNDTRTLHRLFLREFGISFVQWRQQTRLMAALEWLAEGRPIMDVALDLGYQTQSAFAAMFRRNTGLTPTEWQEKRRLPGRRVG